jgi:hypothetical protein
MISILSLSDPGFQFAGELVIITPTPLETSALIHEGVNAFLLASARIAAVAGKSLFPDMAKKGAAYPRIVWLRVDETRPMTLRKSVKLPTARFQFDCWALTRASAARLADALRQDVQDWIDAGANEPWGDVDVRALSIVDLVDDYDPPHDASDVGAYRTRLDLQITYRE